MAELELDHLSKFFTLGNQALCDLSLRVEAGELVVLTGPSGCGKTTTLRLIAGLESPTSGTIRLGGADLAKLSPHERNVAMVFQNHALYPHLTVEANMGFGLAVRGVSATERARRVREAARKLEIEDLLGRRPHELSGGQRQRVALGRALVREPAVFLLDEPLASLDVPLRQALRAQVRQLQRRLGVPTVYVTHDQEEAMSLADRLVVLREGRLLAEGPPQMLYQRPPNRFVAGFLGARRMNFVAGSLESAQGRWVFQETGPEQLTFGGQSLRLYLPRWLADRVACRAGAPVVLGIRPEHLRVGPAADDRFLELRPALRWVEPLGGVVDVIVATALHDGLAARVDARAGAAPDLVGPLVVLHADWRDVCLFEPGETGMNLSPSNESPHA
jgi:multiple sugar transport system ATP-binding protein